MVIQVICEEGMVIQVICEEGMLIQVICEEGMVIQVICEEGIQETILGYKTASQRHCPRYKWQIERNWICS
jgi:hypothetical protein